MNFYRTIEIRFGKGKNKVLDDGLSRMAAAGWLLGMYNKLKGTRYDTWDDVPDGEYRRTDGGLWFDSGNVRYAMEESGCYFVWRPRWSDCLIMEYTGRFYRMGFDGSVDDLGENLPEYMLGVPCDAWDLDDRELEMCLTWIRQLTWRK